VSAWGLITGELRGGSEIWSPATLSASRSRRKKKKKVSVLAQWEERSVYRWAGPSIDWRPVYEWAGSTNWPDGG